jgi:hypothetical protein
VEKPQPEIFQKACEMLRKDPAECVYVGDAFEVDVVGAKAAGMQACWYNPGLTACPAAVIAYRRHRRQAKDVEGDSFFVEGAGHWVTAFRPGELQECLADFDVVSYEEKVIHDTHGQPHTHNMAFLLAQRPG